MYLKRLEMQGFKSFADKTVIELMPGITSVIGPNGSGKSNIADCIKWILGEQSMKSLRGAKTQDVIFAGTQNRKSLGFAEASLIFDNTDGTLPIEYSEVTITRKIYRSGETGYYINKAPCRLKDVVELFMDTGIGRDGYSIIGQGKIDEILSNKSEDRRHIFEEAAGIVKYRTRKEESEKKLEQTKLNVLRINDIITEIEGNLEPLQQQSDKAKQYLNLKEELKNIEVGLFLYNIEKNKKDLEETSKNEEIMRANLNLEEGKLEKIRIQKEEIKSEIDEITNKIEQMQNIGFESQKQIEQYNSNINVDDQYTAPYVEALERAGIFVILNNKDEAKPNATPFNRIKYRMAMKGYEVKSTETLVIGDHLRKDGMFAKNIGSYFAWPGQLTVMSPLAVAMNRVSAGGWDKFKNRFLAQLNQLLNMELITSEDRKDFISRMSICHDYSQLYSSEAKFFTFKAPEKTFCMQGLYNISSLCTVKEIYDRQRILG